jgi:hypothetical protein
VSGTTDMRQVAAAVETLRVRKGSETHRGMLRSVEVAAGESARVEVGFSSATCECGAPRRSSRSARCEPCTVARAREATKQWAARNTEKAKAKQKRARLRAAEKRAAREALPTTLCETCKRWMLWPNPGHRPRFCKPCVAEKQRARARRQRERDPDKLRARTRAWREANPDKERQARQADIEKTRAYGREQSRKRYAANPEKVKAAADAWKAANPEKVRETQHRYRAKKKADREAAKRAAK